MPSKEDGQYQEDPDGLPCHYRGVGVPVVYAMFLLSSVHIQARFPFVHFLRSDAALVLHRPDHVQELGSVGDLVDWDGFVVAHPFVAIQFDPDGLDELVPVMLSSLGLSTGCLGC